VTLFGRVRLFSPEELLAIVLQRLRDISEAHLQMHVAGVVIVVTSVFNMLRRQAIRDACAIVGLYVVDIISPA
jgi:molecular chaperone DnaK (HSP70)